MKANLRITFFWFKSELNFENQVIRALEHPMAFILDSRWVRCCVGQVTSLSDQPEAWPGGTRLPGGRGILQVRREIGSHSTCLCSAEFLFLCYSRALVFLQMKVVLITGNICSGLVFCRIRNVSFLILFFKNSLYECSVSILTILCLCTLSLEIHFGIIRMLPREAHLVRK